MPIINWSLIAPEVIVCAAAVLVMLVDAFVRPTQRWITGGIALVGIVAGAVSVLWLWSTGTPAADAFNGMIVLDEMRLGFTLVFLLVSALTVLISAVWVQGEQLPAGEFHSLLLFATVGMMLMASGNDLVIIFLGLEILSIATYVMAGFRRTDVRSNESSLKYFILGSFSSAFLLYGIALVYGATGTTNLTIIGGRVAVFHLANSPLLLIGIGMMVIGFGFKVATVPFHMWAPDVYEGAPSPITAYMAATVKAAAFAAFMRVFLSAFGNFQPQWGPVLWVLSAASMVVGVTAGVAQRSVRRMLAY